MRINVGSTERLDLMLPIRISNASDVTVKSSNVAVIDIRDVIVSTNYSESGIRHSDVTTISVILEGLRLGKAALLYDLRHQEDWSFDDADEEDNDKRILYDTTNDNRSLYIRYPVVVLKSFGLEKAIHYRVIHTLVALLNFAFGCELDLAIVFSYARRPIPPFIGACSQFIVMPLLGLAIVCILHMDFSYSLGLLLLSFSPGGGPSNSWTVLLGGDVNLSLTMTFFSLILAFGMMPLWLFLMSRILTGWSTIEIPYLNIIITLIEFVGPCLVGILFKRLKPTWAKLVLKLLKPLALVFLVWLFTFGIYSQWYIFQLAFETPVVLLAGAVLPWCGFVFGFLIALVCRQGLKRSATIAIETGIQNIGIPLLTLHKHFPVPESDMAASVVTFSAFFTPVPLFVALICLIIKRLCCGQGKEKSTAVNFEVAAEDNVDEAFIQSGNSNPEGISGNVVHLKEQKEKNGTE